MITVMLIIKNKVSASITGFENPTISFRKCALNLSSMFVHSPSSMRLYESPCDYLSNGVAKGDWLLVDSSRNPVLTDLLLVDFFGDKEVVSKKALLHRESQKIDLSDLVVIGVITMSIHHFRTPSKFIPNHTDMNELDLHKLLVEREHSTLVCRADGNSMLPHIFNDDLLLLERHLNVEENDVCVLALNNDLVCKRVNCLSRTLMSDNPNFKPYKVTAGDYLRLHGVVRYSIRLHRDLLCSPC